MFEIIGGTAFAAPVAESFSDLKQGCKFEAAVNTIIGLNAGISNISFFSEKISLATGIIYKTEKYVSNSNKIANSNSIANINIAINSIKIPLKFEYTFFKKMLEPSVSICPSLIFNTKTEGDISTYFSNDGVIFLTNKRKIPFPKVNYGITAQSTVKYNFKPKFSANITIGYEYQPSIIMPKYGNLNINSLNCILGLGYSLN